MNLLRSAGVGWILLALLLAVAAGQEPPRGRISRLRGELADRFEMASEQVRLALPPSAAIVPGAIVCARSDGSLEIVDRLPPELLTFGELAAPGGELFDRVETRDDDALLRLLVESPSLPDRAMIRVIVREVRRLSLEQQEPEPLSAAALASDPARLAFRQDRAPMLIHDVFVGKLEFEISLEASEGAQFTTSLAGFRLEQPEPGQLRIVADEERPFAFRASLLDYASPAGAPPAVSLRPAPTSGANSSAWELADPPRAAAFAPESADLHDGHEVTVLYATCRAVEYAPRSIASFMGGFVWTANGLFTVAAVIIGVIVVSLALGLMKRLTWVGIVTGCAVGLAAFCGIAWIDAMRQAALASRVTGVYGNRRGDLRYGLSQVSIPERRNVGELNTPFAFYVIQLPEDPRQHFVVRELQEDRDAFFRELKQRVAASTERSAFVFIHGYNVPFADAVKRTAQLALDLQFTGAPICYSWPSQGELLDYVQDSTNAELAAYKLKQLLRDLNAESGAKEIHLIAHSMGNDVLTRALKELGTQALGQTDCVFREILLTAPDIDTELFQTEILPAMLSPRQRITLYASSNDKALNASFELRGSPRAGLAGDNLLVVKGIETIDVSGLDTGFLGHGYYGDHPLVLGDMHAVVREHQSPAQRRLREQSKNGLPYWEFAR